MLLALLIIRHMYTTSVVMVMVTATSTRSTVMYTPCSVAGRVSATGPQLVVMVGEMVVFVYMVVAGLQRVMMGEMVAVYMVVAGLQLVMVGEKVVVVTMLVYPEQLVCPCGRVVTVSIATDPQLAGEQVLVMYMYNMVLVIAGLGEGLLNDLLALVGVVKEALMADVLVVVSPLLVMFIVLVVLVHMPM